ncbi:hypothetical protein [Leptolyngbya sp. NIES-2104]|uniref:hypothetical protein n=1 Tax=Leptolyngbya sp. NIES-2104 TaxID=1552121 RepID=UPI0006ECB226|nr:hypothetical protein [Leptolyngbya sp. NIES-2104]GAP96839.1 signal transduction histidine kinase [Leptolyngbya sp. NIES-2104]
MALEHQNAAGTFLDRQHIETALNQLKATNFPINKISVVAQHVTSDNTTLDPLIEPEAHFARRRLLERLGHGALDAGIWGGIVGILEAGLVTLAVPGVGLTAVAGAEAASVGLAAGAFYGGVAGILLGAAIGTNIPDEQVQRYRERLAQGEYLILVEGTNEEIHQAETVLKTQNVQNWMIFDTL